MKITVPFLGCFAFLFVVFNTGSLGMALAVLNSLYRTGQIQTQKTDRDPPVSTSQVLKLNVTVSCFLRGGLDYVAKAGPECLGLRSTLA